MKIGPLKIDRFRVSSNFLREISQVIMAFSLNQPYLFPTPSQILSRPRHRAIMDRSHPWCNHLCHNKDVNSMVWHLPSDPSDHHLWHLCNNRWLRRCLEFGEKKPKDGHPKLGPNVLIPTVDGPNPAPVGR